MTGFSSLNTALSGMFAAQRAMDVASQNVTNANTPGYSRQRVDLASRGVTATATFFTGNNPTSVGGVDVTDIARIRDVFLEATRQAAGSRQAALDARTSVLTGAEHLLGEPGDAGLQSVLDDFYSAWHDLGQRPTDSAAGSVVLQNGEAAAQTLRSLASGLDARWSTARDDLANAVVLANQTAADLARLNGQIRQQSVVGQPVNEMLDRRDTLVRTLGELVGATAVPGQDGMVSVNVNGISVVNGTEAETLTLAGATQLTAAAGDPPRLQWGTTTVPVASGQAAGLLTALGSDLPDLSEQVDQVAQSLMTAVNTLHQNGFRVPGNVAGGRFFSGTGARDMGVVPTAPDQIAASARAGAVDGSNAQAIADLADDRVARTRLGGPGPSELWRGVTGAVGTTVQSLERAVQIQQSVVAAADDAVEGDAGVNLDEEMTNMLLFQRAYQATARVVTTVDEMMDVLINRTGTVGR